MAKTKLRGKDLAALGYLDATLRSLAMQIVGKAYKYDPVEKQLAVLQELIQQPEQYRRDPHLGVLALKILEAEAQVEQYSFQERNFKLYGAQHIEASAIEQMKQAMSLPISLAGALMPDAHHGYGLPIGGVLATDNAVIPYGVGVDIGCRMCLSIWNAPAQQLDKEVARFSKLLQTHSRFGFDVFEDRDRDDELLDRAEFGQLPLLARLKDKAYQQIGSSGGGNHFVEFGAFLLPEGNEFGLAAGTYLALLSHSGSRGFGAQIADYYTRVAKQKRNLPKNLEHLSWLNLDEQEGQEYWLAMNLAGDYASANHRHIHRRMQRALGYDLLLRVENHHNFAWKETLANGQEAIVHRKGATPAQKGVLGIIPGSMTAPAYLVKGLGAEEALGSASHGAGRLMSRRKAQESITKSMLKQAIKEKGVTLLGGGLDESPFVYKDIQTVMQAQQDLVEVLGVFQPKIVRMDDGKVSED